MAAFLFSHLFYLVFGCKAFCYGSSYGKSCGFCDTQLENREGPTELHLYKSDAATMEGMMSLESRAKERKGKERIGFL